MRIFLQIVAFALTGSQPLAAQITATDLTFLGLSARTALYAYRNSGADPKPVEALLAEAGRAVATPSRKQRGIFGLRIARGSTGGWFLTGCTSRAGTTGAGDIRL